MTHRLHFATHLTPVLAVCFAVLPLAGCPGPDGNDPVALVGTWRELPSQGAGDVPVARRAVLTVTDHTFAVVNGDGTSETASYTADQATISLSGTRSTGATFSQSGPYVVTGDRLLLPALQPVGKLVGVVGSWHSEIVENAEHITLDVVLRADNTAHYDRESTTQAARIYEGTWTQVVDDIKLTFAVPDGLGHTIATTVFQKQLPGRALGDTLYERL